MAKAKTSTRNHRSIRLPPQAAKKLGIEPGQQILIEIQDRQVRILPNIHSLAKIYLEPSSRCNLSCTTCIRRTWNEVQGDMSMTVFEKLIKDLGRFPHLDRVMLGGFGEPTIHPQIIPMIKKLKSLDVQVEMVTNGTLLDEKKLHGLFQGQLDRLWISLDGAEDASFEDIRQGAQFKNVLQNLKRLRDLNKARKHKVALGIAFVMTKKNLSDLKHIAKLAKQIGAQAVSVSNAIPYSPEMQSQMLCNQALTLGTLTNLPDKTTMDFPRMDINESTKEVLWHLMASGDQLSLMGRKISAASNECRFIQDRCSFIRWDGKVSPCMALMHAHETYFRGYKKKHSSHFFGSLIQDDLWDIWNSRDYAAFREKVSKFDFSPCHICGGCDKIDENKSDCSGNIFPTTCGGCLWAQGVIQCP